MTENNKLFNALDQLQLNTNNNDLKALEKEIFTDKNLENIKADEGSDLYNFLNDDKCTINNIINNAYKLSEDEVTNFLTNNKVYKKDQFCSEHGFVAALLNGKAGHFCTYENGKVILNSSDDGRQFNQCCGIHAIEGVLIAEELTKNGKNIKEFKAKHNNQLVKTSEDDLIEQRKILFKMEILDALILQNDKSHLSSFTITPEGNVLPNANAKETPDEERERREREALYKLYFEEFQARCAALQAVKKELEPVIKQTEAQESVHRVVIEEPKKEENDKKFDLPSEPKKENEIVNTQEVIERRQECDTPSKKEPNIITATQTSAVSSTSTNKTPRYKVLERTGVEEKDAGFETYGIDNKPIDIDDESVKLYNKFLDQVLEEFKKEGKIVNIDLIKEKVEEKLFACFSIRNGRGETISEDNYSDKDKENIALAKEDYKYTAEHSELIQNRFNAIEEALKEYNERLAGANKEVHERILKEQEKETATVSVNV